jgi:hypothetical protein
VHVNNTVEECRARPPQPHKGELDSAGSASRLKPTARTNSFHISAVLKRKFSQCSFSKCNSIVADKRSAGGGGFPDPSPARVEVARINIRKGVRGQVDDPTPKRRNLNTDMILGTPHVQANNADVEHTACDITDCIYCIEYGPNMELLAADLWDPLGGGPGKAAVNSNANGHSSSAREIRNAQPTELQMDTDDSLRSHTPMLSNVGFSHADAFNGGIDSECEIRNVQLAGRQMATDTPSRSHIFTLSNVGLSHADDLNVSSERSHVGISHADLSSAGLERAHTPRGRSQSAHSDRGPNGHLRQNDSAEL